MQPSFVSVGVTAGGVTGCGGSVGVGVGSVFVGEAAGVGAGLEVVESEPDGGTGSESLWSPE